MNDTNEAGTTVQVANQQVAGTPATRVVAGFETMAGERVLFTQRK